MPEKDRCENIGKYISQIYRKYGAYISKALSNEGIGHGQWMFLLELYKCDGRNQEDFSDALKMDKGTTARALKKLEDEGLVTRTVDETDKRARKVYLTDKGRDLKSTIYRIFDDCEQIMTEGLDEEEKQIITMLLKKLIKI